MIAVRQVWSLLSDKTNLWWGGGCELVHHGRQGLGAGGVEHEAARGGGGVEGGHRHLQGAGAQGNGFRHLVQSAGNTKYLSEIFVINLAFFSDDDEDCRYLWCTSRLMMAVRSASFGAYVM